MADDGGYSVWGAEEEEEEEEDVVIGQPSVQPVKTASSAKRTSNLFDDLDDANADWGIQPSPPAEIESGTSKRLSLLEDISSTTFPISPPLRSAESAFDASDRQVENLADQLDSSGFDDFDEGQFASAGATGGDDDFGDFGEFDDDQGNSFEAPIPKPIEEVVAKPGREWQPLSISKDTDAASLENDIRKILAPAFPNGRMYPFHDGAASQLSQDKIRQVEGEAQVLVREESRNMWLSLTSQSDVKPVDWMRSSTRRQHLIALGVPINLDEVRVNDTAGTKSLPPLSLKLDQKPSDTNGKSIPPRNGTPDNREAKAPGLDAARVKELTSLTEDQLTLLALPTLRDISREMESLTRQASARLTHYLSQREVHNADAEMYNGLIRDLVTGAANRFGATSVKRSNTLRKSSTNSGRNSPAPSK